MLEVSIWGRRYDDVRVAYEPIGIGADAERTATEKVNRHFGMLGANRSRSRRCESDQSPNPSRHRRRRPPLVALELVRQRRRGIRVGHTRSLSVFCLVHYA